ncbi:hypothetical protein [Microbulbifer marinus]|uniref:Uncharacterized protein n=1 Tax=Microbulbifer marinus TaxID=658218 RepID=A0A1H4A542_9GAMM|nr:hypothetical protein [Microbulbifer marinus]SEA30781.1 hypothetical protein SAMN05216562_2537 [Microbulbifer marinus]
MSAAWLSIGFVTAIVIGITFHKRGLEASRKGYPYLLFTFPLYYWLFASSALDGKALLNEVAASIPFFIIAWLALKSRRRLRWFLVGVGMVIHGIYDVYHDLMFINTGSPDWWPEFCGIIDVVLGGYLLALAAGFKPEKEHQITTG